jgi:hypothetical protein
MSYKNKLMATTCKSSVLTIKVRFYNEMLFIQFLTDQNKLLIINHSEQHITKDRALKWKLKHLGFGLFPLNYHESHNSWIPGIKAGISECPIPLKPYQILKASIFR